MSSSITSDAGAAPVDTAKGIQNLGGNARLYSKILAEFAADHALDVSHARELIRSGDVTGAFRIFHTLKGLLGTIGATECQAVSASCAESLHQGTLPEDDKLVMLDHQFEDVCLWIRRQPDCVMSQPAPQAADMAGLRLMIEAMDPASEQALEAIGALPDITDHDAYVTLRDHLHNFEFYEALVPLAVLEGRLATSITTPKSIP